MPSWQSQLVNFVIRNRHLMRGKLKREVWVDLSPVEAFRAQCEAGAKRTPMPAGIEVLPVRIPGLPAGLAAEWLQPGAGAVLPLAEDAAIFYVHGGGYISGSCADHRALVAKITAGSGVRTLLYEYRLAPEHAYPAAMEDTLCAYRWLLEQVAPSTRIIIAGESAGGGLCLAALLAIRNLGLRMPAAGIAMSPWTDLKLTGASHVTKARAAVDVWGMSQVCSKAYAGDNDPGLPGISPLYGDLRGLPPLLIDVGDDEMLRDDAIMFAEKAKAAGVEVTLNVAMGQVHVYPLLPDFIPESKAALEEICAFIRKHIRMEVATEG